MNIPFPSNAIIKSSSWHHLLYILLLILHFQIIISSSSPLKPTKRCHPEESAALINFRRSFSGNSSHADCFCDIPPPDWKDSIDCCSWGGVECDDITGNVISVDLSCGWLHGTISSNSTIFHLPHLQTLELSCNNFSFSSIPPELSKLTQLKFLDLSSTNLAGKIPDELGNLSQLTTLSLSGNSLSGQLPYSIFNLRYLQDLNLGFNQLEGPLPGSISHGLSSLASLTLSNNMLVGKVPSWLFTIPALQSLLLFNNNLSGPIEQFEQQTSPLVQVGLSNNQINGPIPGSLFGLVNLTFLELSANNFSGAIEWSLLQERTNLRSLDLSGNSGLSLRNSDGAKFNLPLLMDLSLSSCSLIEFPSYFSALENLASLNLSNNMIGGRITKQDAEGWKSLTYLDLSHNLLTGLDQYPGSSIFELDLSYNLLQGSLVGPPASIAFLLLLDNQLTGQIPATFCNLSNLKFLDLSNNNLNGLLPQCFGNLNDDLEVLNLKGNRIQGSIPDTFGTLSAGLRVLDLNDNEFEGKLPRSLLNCSKLEVLDLGNNNLSDTFPGWLEGLSNLSVLILRSNGLHGNIGNPRTESPFPWLLILDLSHNKFTGLLPARYLQNLKRVVDTEDSFTKNSDSEYVGIDVEFQEYAGFDNKITWSTTIAMKGSEFEMVKVLFIFTSIDLSCNEFSGEIPQVVGSLKSLKVLNMSHNNLYGHIPSSLGNLTDLESLDLSSNKLSGEIPQELIGMTFLEVLNLSYNQLHGPIPQGKQFGSFSNDSYISNLGLCGFPMSMACGNGQPPPPLLSVAEEEEDSADGFDWKLATLMGYVCGLVLGVSLGYIILTTGRLSWLVIVIEKKQYKVLKRTRKGRRRGRKI